MTLQVSLRDAQAAFAERSAEKALQELTVQFTNNPWLHESMHTEGCYEVPIKISLLQVGAQNDDIRELLHKRAMRIVNQPAGQRRSHVTLFPGELEDASPAYKERNEDEGDTYTQEEYEKIWNLIRLSKEINLFKAGLSGEIEILSISLIEDSNLDFPIVPVLLLMVKRDENEVGSKR